MLLGNLIEYFTDEESRKDIVLEFEEFKTASGLRFSYSDRISPKDNQIITSLNHSSPTISAILSRVVIEEQVQLYQKERVLFLFGLYNFQVVGILPSVGS